MKRLYEFSLYKTATVKEKSESTNDKGEKVITEKDVEKKVEHKYILRKPTRSMYDDAELFYGVRLAEGVKAGLLNHALLAKRYNNDGGIFTDDQQEDFANSYFELLNELINSIKNFKESSNFAICVVDAGLTDNQRNALSKKVDEV